MHRATAILLAASLLAVAGCRKPTLQAEAQQQLAHHAALKLTSQSHHEPLQAELALVQASLGLPRQIDADRGIASNSADEPSEFAAALNSAFTASQLKFTRQRSDGFFAAGVDEWNPLVLEQALQFRNTYDMQHQRLRQALALPGAGLRLPLSAGLGLNSAFADAALVYVRFEAIAAAESISRGDASAAMQAIARAMQASELLADEPHVVARLTAASARRETFGVIQRLVTSRIATAAHLAQLEQLVGRQLAAWPIDAAAWIGDRALGLCIYEMIRDGQVLSVLTEDELVAIRRGEGVEVFAAAVAKHVDVDETHYLRTMREAIRLCEQPYHERRRQLETFDRERHALRSSPDYPIVADRFLLGGIDQAQRRQAADLALTRAWSMALAIASGASLPPPEVNPLTGEKFDVLATSERVIVTNIDPHRPELQVIVPLASPQIQSARRPRPAVR